MDQFKQVSLLVKWQEHSPLGKMINRKINESLSLLSLSNRFAEHTHTRDQKRRRGMTIDNDIDDWIEVTMLVESHRKF